MKIKNELLQCDIQFPKVSHLHKNRDVTLLEMCIALLHSFHKCHIATELM